MIMKVQPLDLIQKYYGPEVAFYFAFAGHLNTMTIPAALLGMCSVIYGLLTVDTDINHMSNDICKSDLDLCPYCNSKTICQYSRVKDFCMQSKLSYTMDNMSSFVYAVLMCFWATLFLELWKRKQAKLCYRWNLTYVEEDASSRPSFRIQAKHSRISKYTGHYEPYVPTRIRFVKMMCSFIIIVISAIIVLAAVILSVILKIFLKFVVVKIRPDTKRYIVTFLSTSIGNCAIVVFMLVFEQVYNNVAKFLTEYENPRTQSDYDKSYIYKVYVLSFMNAYAFLYYTAFITGRLYTSPDDISKYEGIGLVRTDACGPEGCVMYLSYQLIFILVAKSIFNHALSFLTPLALPFIKRKLQNKKLISTDVKIWEYSFYFEVPSTHYYLLKLHLETVIYFGFIILFTATFPLAPLISLLFNGLMLRLYAFKLTKINRRPVPLSVAGIRAWNNILRTLTYIGIATNAFLISFTTNLIPIVFTLVHEQYHKYGYLNASLSEFYISDFDESADDAFRKGREGSCYYVSKRNPPYHEKKYVLTGSYWEELAMRFLCVLAIEGFVLCFTALLAFIIPDIPRSIQDRLNVRERQEMVIREKQLNAAFKNLN